MSELKPQIQEFIKRLSPRQQEYVLSRLAAKKDAYLVLHFSGQCQRCSETYYKVHVKVTENNVYLYHWRATGTRCYLGPIDYIYVTRTHKVPAPLHGAGVSDRILRYIERLENYIKTIDNVEELEVIERILKDIESVIEFRKNQLKK